METEPVRNAAVPSLKCLTMPRIISKFAKKA